METLRKPDEGGEIRQSGTATGLPHNEKPRRKPSQLLVSGFFVWSVAACVGG
jgi:hypothetical protein